MRSHSVLRSPNDTNRHELRVAFIVNNRIKESILDFVPINGRLCILRLKTRFFNLLIINVHAETEDKDNITKKKFYQELERAYDGILSNDIKVIMGDFNAKIGREPIYKKVIGNQSLHENSNDNGLRVIDFASSRDMLVSSTCFARPDI